MPDKTPSERQKIGTLKGKNIRDFYCSLFMLTGQSKSNKFCFQLMGLNTLQRGRFPLIIQMRQSQ